MILPVLLLASAVISAETAPAAPPEARVEAAAVPVASSPEAAWPEGLRPRLLPAPEGGPLSLEAAIATGLARAPEIRAAEAEIERIDAGIGVIRAGAWPQVNATGNARRFETWKATSAFSTGDYATLDAGVTVTQSIYNFGRLSKGIQAARAEESAAVANLYEARSSVRYRVEAAFLSLLLEREREAVAREAFEVAGALLDRARAREGAGAGTLFDVTRAEAERAAALAGTVAAEAAVHAAREALAVSMGLPAGRGVVVEGDLASAVSPVDPDAAERIALEERPGLALLAHRVRSNDLQVEYQRALGRPSIDAVASATNTWYRYDAPSAFSTGKEASSGFAGVGITIPVFDGWRVRENTRMQRAVADGVRAQFDRARLETIREVRGTYYDLGAAREALAARREGVRAAREALRMAEVSFDAGRATSLDVIQASLALTQARRAEAEAAFAYRLGIARLVRSAGTDEVLRARGLP